MVHDANYWTEEDEPHDEATGTEYDERGATDGFSPNEHRSLARVIPGYLIRRASSLPVKSADLPLADTPSRMKI